MNFTSKFIETALLKYIKIKEDPILVENWFDNEIIKIRMVTENNSSSIDNKSLINKIK